MKTTKRLIFFIPVLLMICAIPNRLQATHAEGMQLTYTHLSGAVYRLSLTWYRDCSVMLPAPVSIPIQVSSISCGVNQSHTLFIDSNQTQTITLICPYDSANCIGGNAPAFEKNVYENDITLSGQCSDWIFDVAVSARNNAITTLQNPGGDDIYIEAKLNNSTSDNNSPQFTNDPIIFLCADQDFHYNHGIYDAEGDSISYHMITPRTDANTPVIYNLGYSVNNPLSSNPPVSFNDFTGDLLMHPLAMEVAVMAFEIKDWRNGELMGSVMRDVMVYIVPCGTYPTATGMNGTSQQILYVLPDDTVCFDVLSDDIDVTDTITMSWNQTIPNATFVTNGIPHPTGTFCWTPTINDVRSQPYMFTVMVDDNTCPLVNACIYSYFIYVTLDSSLVWAGINGPGQQEELSVYPNPSTGLYTLKTDKNILGIKIYNYTGDCIRKNISGHDIDLRNEPPGIYFIESANADGTKTVTRIVKTKPD